MTIVGIPFFKILMSTLSFEDNQHYETIKDHLHLLDDYDYTEVKKDLKQGTTSVINTYLQLEFTNNINERDR